ncbi:hypothetical protein LuPra_02593 [Luteitalea pratensis]|uniref:Uncharacterized protein n=1 Tax=Luteitalea pratensis TaxID=1855912 RepID=A0A143PMR5_LUTPR|nr:hypothetical protein LuPra_02593 [Luteitalea pratensis]
MAKARPDLFDPFVGTGQVADPATSDAVAYGELLTKAEMLKDARAGRELREVGPPPYPDGRGYRVQRKWSNLFEGADGFIFSMVGLALAAPGCCHHSTSGRRGSRVEDLDVQWFEPALAACGRPRSVRNRHGLGAANTQRGHVRRASRSR